MNPSVRLSTFLPCCLLLSITACESASLRTPVRPRSASVAGRGAAHSDPRRGGPRRLAIALSSGAKRALADRKLSPGSTIQLIVSFDVPKDSVRQSALPQTKAHDNIVTAGLPEQYTVKATVGLGHLVLRSLDGNISGVVLKKASGDEPQDLSGGPARQPDDSIDDQSVFIPVDSRDFAPGSRAQAVVELAGRPPADSGDARFGVGLEAELRYRLVRKHPQLTLGQQESCTGYAGITFGVAVAGHLELMSMSRIYQQQHDKMQSDRAFFRRSRLSASTIDPARHRALTADELKQIEQDPDLEDIEEVWTDITSRTGGGQ